jgi:conjugal transfer/entry exclusion protein
MTHLLISIEEVEQQIAHYKGALDRFDNFEWHKSLDNNGRTHDYYRAQGFIAIYEKLLATAKQISLDGKDIDKQFNQYVKDNYSTGVGVNVAIAYKDALRSLL